MMLRYDAINSGTWSHTFASNIVTCCLNFSFYAEDGGGSRLHPNNINSSVAQTRNHNVTVLDCEKLPVFTQETTG